MKVVNLRELKNRLGTYVKEVRAGETILITDRGTVVAELRPSLHAAGAPSGFEAVLERWAAEGRVRLGLPHDPAVYRKLPWSSPAGLVERLLDESRGER